MSYSPTFTTVFLLVSSVRMMRGEKGGRGVVWCLGLKNFQNFRCYSGLLDCGRAHPPCHFYILSKKMSTFGKKMFIFITSVMSENDRSPYMRNMRLRVSFLISLKPFSYKVKLQEIILSSWTCLMMAELSETWPRIKVLSGPSVME